MPITSETRTINLLQPIATLIARLGSLISKDGTRDGEILAIDNYVTLDSKGRLVVKDEDEVSYISLLWDRLDESLVLQVTKDSAKDQFQNNIRAIDDVLLLDQKNHRVYPAFTPGNPTVAGQFQSQKGGFKETELPSGNVMTATFSNLDTIELNFDNAVIAKSIDIRAMLVQGLPNGEILGFDLTNNGSGYINGQSYTLVSENTGSGAEGTVTATTTLASQVSIGSVGSGYASDQYYSAVFNDEARRGQSNGLQLYIVTNGSGSVTQATIQSGYEGNGPYVVGDELTIYGGETPATFTVTQVTGGEVNGFTLTSGGVNFTLGETVTINGGGAVNATIEVTKIVDTPTSTEEFKVFDVSFEEDKTNTVTITLSDDASYDRTYRVYANSVLNLARESTNLTAEAITEPQPEACAPITSILFEAYGSEEQTLTPRTLAQYESSHTNNEFIYFQAGLSWSAFITRSEFTETPIQVPEGVTAPDKVYVYYKEGTYLLPDAAWFVGIIGDETDYVGNDTYVLYTLDSILNYIQITPAGTSTAVCGTNNWGGDWGSSIQQFAINR